MKTWILSARGESGDAHHGIGDWDHEPSEDEINRELICYDTQELDPNNSFHNSWTEGYIKLDGKEYITYMHEIEVFTVGEDPSAHDPSARVPASGENLP